jgi:menaquinone-9 beta-reductase
VCTHFIQSSGVPTIERLGLMPPIEEAGGLLTGGEFWTRWGWIRPPAARNGDRSSLNLRREKLDPIVRWMAAETDGVELMLGQSVDTVLRDGHRLAGVESVGRDGVRRRIDARLVVAADGRGSGVAELAGVAARVKPHNRFAYFAYYEGVPLASGTRAQMWFLDPDMAYGFPTDDGLTLLACAPAKERLAEFKGDLEQSFTRFMRSLPDPPPIDRGRRVSKLIGKLEMPNTSRPAARPGIAFVGDAALASDPLWGVGCGWAFQSAEWLVDETADALLGAGNLDRALARYRLRHRRHLRAYEWLNCDYATARKLNPMERMLYSAAARDQAYAGHFEAFGTRNMAVRQFLGPRSLARAAWINVRHRFRPGRDRAAQPSVA